jgi:endogenous inhibitor of DNA gyrase (YacG/DUF329 family)
MSTTRCPICGKHFEPHHAEAMPFCSVRCKQVDLGRWIQEHYGLPCEPEDQQESPESLRDEQTDREA